MAKSDKSEKEIYPQRTEFASTDQNQTSIINPQNFIIMIQYVVKEKKNPITGKSKFYPQIAKTNPVTLNALVGQISYATTVTPADVKAVLDALQQQIIFMLTNGQTIRMGDVGSFRPTITSDGADEKKKANANLITKVNVRFTKGSKLRSNFMIGAEAVKFIGPNETAATPTNETGTTTNP